MSKFGRTYRHPAGYAVEVGEQSTYNHRFGGSSWKVVDPHPVEDGLHVGRIIQRARRDLAGLRRRGLDVEVVHPIQLLDQAYQQDSNVSRLLTFQRREALDSVSQRG